MLSCQSALRRETDSGGGIPDELGSFELDKESVESPSTEPQSVPELGDGCSFAALLEMEQDELTRESRSKSSLADRKRNQAVARGDQERQRKQDTRANGHGSGDRRAPHL